MINVRRMLYEKPLPPPVSLTERQSRDIEIHDMIMEIVNQNIGETSTVTRAIRIENQIKLLLNGLIGIHEYNVQLLAGFRITIDYFYRYDLVKSHMDIALNGGYDEFH